jgi:hypothetical protein
VLKRPWIVLFGQPVCSLSAASVSGWCASISRSSSRSALATDCTGPFHGTSPSLLSIRHCRMSRRHFLDDSIAQVQTKEKGNFSKSHKFHQ